MNDESPFDLTEQRLARDLRSAASGMPLAPGSEVAVVATGRRRRHRRRQVNAIALVAATGIGTAFTIRQLARTGDSSVATDTLPATESTGSVPDSAVPAPTAPIDASVPASSIPGSVPPVSTPAAGDDIPPAQIMESNMVWNVVEPDSTEAVGYGNVMLSSRGPVIALATEPGRNDDYAPQVWRSEDGVSWTPIDVDVPFGRVESARFAGDKVYVVGTAPGIAKSRPNPLLFGVSSDDGATWEQMELPVDTNAGRDLPFVEGVSSTAAVYPLDDGAAAVFLYTGAILDWDAIAEELGVPATDALAGFSTRDGVSVSSDPNCPDATVVVGTVPIFAGSPIQTTPPAADPCQGTLVAWDEIGVPQETVDLAYGRKPREFLVVDGNATEIPVPDDVRGNYFANNGSQALFTTDDGRWYEMGPDGVLVASDSGVYGGYPVGANADARFVQISPDGGMFGTNSTGVGASTNGGQWVHTDWSDLVGDGQVGYAQQASVTSAGIVQIFQAMPDGIAAQGGISVSSGGFTASRATAKSPVVITNDATGETVDPRNVFYGPDGVVLQDADGNQIGRMDGPSFQSILNDTRSNGVIEDFLVAVSADGQHVSVESISQLLGVDASEISWVPRISAAGNTTVIAVTMKERNPDGTPKQLVLVGTPKN